MISGLRPSWRNGIAQVSSESYIPELWRGKIGHWVPALGTTGVNLRDVSGNRRHGALESMVLANSWTHKLNWPSLYFDGTDDRVNIPNSMVSQIDTLTHWNVSAWLNPDSAAVHGAFLGHGNPYNTAGEGFILDYRGTLGGDPLRIIINNDSGAPTTVNIAAGDIAGVWSHVSANINRGGNIEYFLNGVSLGATSIAAQVGGTLNSGTPLYIGQYGEYSSYHWQGHINDVRIYNRELPVREIQLMYRYPLIDLIRRPPAVGFVSAPAVGGHAFPAWLTRRNIAAYG